MNKNIKCYLCNKKTTGKAFEKLGWTILKCNSCKLYCLLFKHSYENFIKEYYDKRFFTGSKERAGYFDYEGDKVSEIRNMKTYLKGIKEYKKSGKLLDVGCATGLFMKEAEKQGFDVFGIDVSDYAIKIAKKRFGKKVQLNSIEKAKFIKQEFDVITLFDIVEHVNDPRIIIKKLSTFLNDSGVLVINTGDAESLLAKIQGKDWHFFIPPQHFFNFSKSNLELLLDQAGFKIIKVNRKGKWISLRYLFHLAYQIQNDIFGKIGFSLVANNFLGKIPIYLNLFDNITIYAEKKDN